MYKFMLITVFLLMIGLAVGICSITAIYLTGANKLLDIDVISHTTKVRRGEEFKITYRFMRYQTCQLQVERIIKNIDKNVEYTTFMGERTGTYTPEPISSDVTTLIPAQAPLGKYDYHSNVKYNCNIANRLLGLPYYMETPHVQFEVVE